MANTRPCRDCGTDEPALHYRSGKMPRCHDCQHYRNLVTKATGGVVEFTREEFVEWRRGDPARRVCSYCGLGQDDLYAANVVNPRTKKRMEVIGVDRRDNSIGYRLTNLVPACGVCNAVKSSMFTEAEMKIVGRSVADVLRARITATS